MDIWLSAASRTAPPARPQRARRRAGRCLVALAGLATPFLGATAVASAGGSSVNYSATVTIPAPPSSNFSGASAGGDGWALAFSSTQVFNVFHHQTYLAVNCHNQAR